MIFSENVLSVASRMILIPMFSWISLRVGWKILKEIRKHNDVSLIKLENPPLFLALNQSLPLLTLPTKDPKIDTGKNG